MRLTAILRQRAFSASAAPVKRHSVALSVYFCQPTLGMKAPEILSRASAFLLSVDGPTSDPVTDGPYGHLAASAEQREATEYKRIHGRSRPTGTDKRMIDMSWLEFVPREVRPQVHLVCCSHVVSPYLWKDYYPQDWLSEVRPEHCSFFVEVYDEENPEMPLAKIDLDSEPYHHPEGRDIALVHFRDEKSALKTLRNLGVEALHVRDPEKLYEKGEEISFEGYTVIEEDTANEAAYKQSDGDKSAPENQEDDRSFLPYKESGKLMFHTEDRFFCSTPRPLPQGLCGAPALDTDGALCGTVEGIVPVDHPNKNIAGAAAFFPSYMMQAFVDFVERELVKKMMPKDLFQMVVTAKNTNSITGGVFTKDKKGTYTEQSSWEEEHEKAMDELKKRYSKEEVDSILKIVRSERDEVLTTFDKDGGDMDTIIERVRHKTMQLRELVHDQMANGQIAKKDTTSTK